MSSSPKDDEHFTVLVSDPDWKDGQPHFLDQLPGWHYRPRGRAFCRRVARQCIFEGADYALVVDLTTGEIVRIYTPNNAPVARPRKDGRCPIRFGNDTNDPLSN